MLLVAARVLYLALKDVIDSWAQEDLIEGVFLGAIRQGRAH